MTHSPRSRLAPVLAGMVLFAVMACSGSSGDSPVAPPTNPPVEPPPAPSDTPVAVPAQGDAATFDVATWNIEWFGDTGNGPQDETKQLNRVRDVIRGAQIELWGVQEVTGASHFSRLLDSLPGYRGLLANDASVENGPNFYSDFNNNEQKVGLIYQADAVEVVSARIIVTEEDYAFAGRPPLEVEIRASVGGQSVEGVVIVLHAKAGADLSSWQRRSDAAAALKAYLDEVRPESAVWVIGDFNDDLDSSIASGQSSPYAGFLTDSEAWVFVTQALTDAGESSTTGYDDMIDHQLVSDEVHASYVDGSVKAFKLDDLIARYDDTTSDHYPIIARYRLPDIPRN